MKLSGLLPYVLLAPTIIMLLFISIFPLFYLGYFSFFDYELIFPTVTFVGLNNYVSAVQDPIFISSLVVTAVFVLVALPMETGLGFVLALILDQKARGGASRAVSVIRMLFMIPMMVAPLVAGYLWKFMYWPDIGLIDRILHGIGIATPEWVANPQTALPSLIVVDVWQWVPFTFLILFAGLQALPDEPFEAAMMDGASRVQVFRDVTLPMLRRIIAVAVLFRFAFLMAVFDQPKIITDGGPGFSTYSAALYIYKVGLSQQFRIGYGAALSWILNLLTMVVVFIFLMRIFSRKEESR